ncbi:MAG: hypothetical protein JWL97_3004 [Gemmatimonadales bacterium]|nr:hypothetical protein [Gemmatimonadales bacterium]
MESGQEFDCWAIVEAMGFKKYAGHVTTQEIAGSSFIRVDVPETSTPAFSKLIGAGSIYMITPTDEATARKAAAVLARGESPLPVYIPPEPKQLPAQIDDSPARLSDDDFVDDHCEICNEFESECTCSELDDLERPESTVSEAK